MLLNNVAPYQCPKFDSCSAPICPLDPHWKTRSHRKGERVCLYLREAAKGDLTLENVGNLPETVREKISEVYPQIVNRHGAIKNAVNRAATKGSKLQSISRLRRQK